MNKIIYLNWPLCQDLSQHWGKYAKLWFTHVRTLYPPILIIKKKGKYKNCETYNQVLLSFILPVKSIWNKNSPTDGLTDRRINGPNRTTVEITKLLQGKHLTSTYKHLCWENERRVESEEGKKTHNYSLSPANRISYNFCRTF